MDESAAPARGWRADRGIHLVWPDRYERLGQCAHKSARAHEQGRALYARPPAAEGGAGISQAGRELLVLPHQQLEVPDSHLITSPAITRFAEWQRNAVGRGGGERLSAARPGNPN